jgi:hypothetical protein
VFAVFNSPWAVVRAALASDNSSAFAMVTESIEKRRNNDVADERTFLIKFLPKALAR